MKKALLALCLPLVLFGCANNSNQTESGTNLCDKIDETVDRKSTRLNSSH